MKPLAFVLIGICAIIMICIISSLIKHRKNRKIQSAPADICILTSMTIEEAKRVYGIGKDDRYKLMFDTLNEEEKRSLYDNWQQTHKTYDQMIEIRRLINSMYGSIMGWKEDFTVGDLAKNLDIPKLRILIRTSHELEDLIKDMKAPGDDIEPKPEVAEIPENSTMVINNNEGELHYL